MVEPIAPTNLISAFLLSRRTMKPNVLSVGLRLCSIVAALCVAPLAFVHVWIAVWLLTLMTIIVLGTFGIFAFHSVRNPELLRTEDHVEQMARITQVIGYNRPDQVPETIFLGKQPAEENPLISERGNLE